MPVNIEIKARVSDPDRLRALAEGLSGSSGVQLEQEDIFYVVSVGRLKLRKIIGEDSPCKLYFYKRDDLLGPKQSDYECVSVTDSEQMNLILSQALGVLGVVKKSRVLHLVGQTRIHLDLVENLGHFMELEVMLKDGQSGDEGKQIAKELMSKLDIKEEDLVECAYIDLLLDDDSRQSPPIDASLAYQPL